MLTSTIFVLINHLVDSFCRIVFSIIFFLLQAYWIGLSDTYAEGSYYWVNKVLLNSSSFTNWDVGEPSNNFKNEDCVEMYGEYGVGKWNDNYCNSIRDYICEKASGMLMQYWA